MTTNRISVFPYRTVSIDHLNRCNSSVMSEVPAPVPDNDPAGLVAAATAAMDELPASFAADPDDAAGAPFADDPWSADADAGFTAATADEAEAAGGAAIDPVALFAAHDKDVAVAQARKARGNTHFLAQGKRRARPGRACR